MTLKYKRQFNFLYEIYKNTNLLIPDKKVGNLKIKYKFLNYIRVVFNG